MCNINYASRYKKVAFCEEDVNNLAKRAMLFSGFEYNAGGEPVYRSSKLNVRKIPRANRFLAQRRRDALKRRIKARRRGVSVMGLRGHIKAVIEMKARRGKLAPKRASNNVRVIWGR